MVCVLTQCNSHHNYSPYIYCFSMKILQHAMCYPHHPYNGSCLWIERKSCKYFFSPVIMWYDVNFWFCSFTWLHGFPVAVSIWQWQQSTYQQSQSQIFLHRKAETNIIVLIFEFNTLNPNMYPSMHLAKSRKRANWTVH